MAEGTTPTGAVSRFVEMIDHPLVFAVFALAVTFMVVPMMALMTALFKFLGWPGPASLVQTP